MPGLQPSLAESCVLSPELAVLQSCPCKKYVLSFFLRRAALLELAVLVP